MQRVPVFYALSAQGKACAYHRQRLRFGLFIAQLILLRFCFGQAQLLLPLGLQELKAFNLYRAPTRILAKRPTSS
jgi:hypothetical protein